jgi:hypothetical protein
LADECVQIREELLVGEIGEIHRSLLPSRISGSGLAHQRTIGRVRGWQLGSRENDDGNAYRSPHGMIATRPADVSPRTALNTSTQIDIEHEETVLGDGSGDGIEPQRSPPGRTTRRTSLMHEQTLAPHRENAGGRCVCGGHPCLCRGNACLNGGYWSRTARVALQREHLHRALPDDFALEALV